MTTTKSTSLILTSKENLPNLNILEYPTTSPNFDEKKTITIVKNLIIEKISNDINLTLDQIKLIIDKTAKEIFQKSSSYKTEKEALDITRNKIRKNLYSEKTLAKDQLSILKEKTLGVTILKDGYNFGLQAEKATKVFLVIFFKNELVDEIPVIDKVDNYWHIFIRTKISSPHIQYGYRIEGPSFDSSKIISDPKAKALNIQHPWGIGNGLPPLGLVSPSQNDFDWQDHLHLKFPLQKKDLIIYEAHLRGFTKGCSEKVMSSKISGTYLGLIEKIPYLQSLGINAIELLPVFSFNEMRYGENFLRQYWGYSPINFFSPMSKYSSQRSPGIEINEFKKMVRELHKEGIEIILDVVFNHTSETKDYVLNLKGLDPSYYILSKGNDCNYSGCGNTLSCNSLRTQQLIIDSLKYWIQEMGVDGFRFDLGATFFRDQKGNYIDNPPILKAIQIDPIISKTKLIAEPWDMGMNKLGTFPYHGPWSEWNDNFRSSVRKFIMSSKNSSENFATAICGSYPTYSSHKPSCSINYICSHDGFSLTDLVSYQQSHNESNYEEFDHYQKDDCWNCGTEGPTLDPKILKLRDKQKRNLLLALFVSRGIPMIQMGDEYGHTKKGNSNTWCQDNELSWFQWEQMEQSSLTPFVKELIKFRNNNPILKKDEFHSDNSITWHGYLPFKPNWKSNLVAFTLKENNEDNLYIAFNSSHEGVSLQLPPPKNNKMWYRIIDTNLESSDNFTKEEKKIPLTTNEYYLHPYSSLLLKQL